MSRGFRRALFFLTLLLLLTSVGGRGTIVAMDCGCLPDPELTLGMENEDVYGLQNFLLNQGFFPQKPTGYYDRQTMQGVKLFQAACGLPVTGRVDVKTWRAIGNSNGGEPVSTSPPPGNLVVIVDIQYLTLTVFVDGQPFKSFPVAIGKRETPSPVGDWVIINKGSWSGGFGTRWIGLSVPYGVYGIHGTDKPWSIGRMESHGCIRMFNRDIEELYRWVKPGDRVSLVGDAFMGHRILMRGERGADVWFLQKRLRQLGYYQYKPDGVFGYGTEMALKTFQKEHKLPVTGQTGWREYSALRLIREE